MISKFNVPEGSFYQIDDIPSRFMTIVFFKLTGITSIRLSSEPQSCHLDKQFQESSFLDLLLVTNLTEDKVRYWYNDLPIGAMLAIYPEHPEPNIVRIL